MNQHAKRRQASKRQAGHAPAGYIHADFDDEAEAPAIAAAGPSPVRAVDLDYPRTFHVDAQAAGQRLDLFLGASVEAAGGHLSRTRLQALADSGHVTIDARAPHSASDKVRLGQVIRLDVPPAEPAEPQGEDIALAVAYEDDYLLVIDKPAGLVVHPGAGHATGTLVNALIHHCGASLSGIGGVRRPGIVHRLDKDTSGLLVVAKTDAAHAGLSALFADHGRTLSLTRRYVALVWGGLDRSAGMVDAPLGRHATHREKMAVVPAARGRDAITHFRVEEGFGSDRQRKPRVSRIICELETGRTHQIRVHLAHIGHPVLGDPVYAAGFRTRAALLGNAAQAALEALGRQALHAQALGFAHPVTGEDLLFESQLPADMASLLEALRQEN